MRGDVWINSRNLAISQSLRDEEEPVRSPVYLYEWGGLRGRETSFKTSINVSAQEINEEKVAFYRQRRNVEEPDWVLCFLCVVS